MRLQAIAYHLEKRITLSTVRNQFKSYNLVKREHSFLLYKIKNGSYIYLKDYGSVVFINCEDVLINKIVSFLTGKEKSTTTHLPSEKYTIVFSDMIEVDFGSIQIKELNDDVAHTIMLNLAQSVALMNYVNKTSDLHDKTLVYSRQLERTGSFKLSKVQMRKFIGKTMNLKNNIAENLFVFDSPDVAWNNKDLSDLDYKLKDELDIIKRHQGIENSLNVIKENLDLFSDILQHKYSSMLEWIIIILILFEVVQVIIEKLI
ncbi:RMD1 family protein [Tenacibaculum caenipelagi]|uniref:Putative Rmd1/YagE family protein n=1 Tax=Tenacibaculum caenipelagi TaxID=1325435 RepID=A0A4V3D3J9_9FLAO|nr:RMD1 family protein [Tenacibaculum caenipelagi]TDQ30112.1 putative Rmd1/YagE family protein [Tenacibaculum caenipelagi]